MDQMMCQPPDQAARNPQDQSREAVWGRLHATLAGVLAQLTDPAEQDLLVIDLHGSGADTVPFVQVASFGDGRMLRVEAVGDKFLSADQSSPERADLMSLLGWEGNDGSCPNWYAEHEVANSSVTAGEIVTVIREGFGIDFASQLECKLSGPASDAANALDPFGCGHRLSQPVEDLLGDNAGTPIVVADQLALVDAVVRVAREDCAIEPEVDGADIHTITKGNHAIVIRTHFDASMIEVIAHRPNKYPSSSTRASGKINRANPFLKWIASPSEVRQSTVLPCAPFVPAHLRQALKITDFGCNALHADFIWSSNDWT